MAICKAVWCRKGEAAAPRNFAVQGRSSGFGTATRPKMCSGEGREVLGTALEYTTALACGRHVWGCGCRSSILTNQRTNDAVPPE